MFTATVCCKRKKRSRFWEGISALEELQVSGKKAFLDLTQVAGASLERSGAAGEADGFKQPKE